MKFWVVISFLLMTSSVHAQEEKFVYGDHGRRDPMKPLVSPTITFVDYETDFRVTDLRLEGIMSGQDGQSIAVINGQIVKTNDKVGEFVIMRITTDTVELKGGEQKFQLKLKKEE
jgi:hypothetical protein